jgi:hypothetical protein
MMRLTEIMSGAAFTVADDDYPGVLASISGPYVTFWQEQASGLWDAPAALNPVHHSEGGSDGSGITQISGADLYDEALGHLRDFATGSGLFAEGDPEDGEDMRTRHAVREWERYGQGEECNCGCGATSAPPGRCECGQPLGHS